MRLLAAHLPPAVQDVVARLPFDCVARCTCAVGGCACTLPGCSSGWFIVVGALLEIGPGARGVLLFVRTEPGAELVTLVESSAQLEAVGYRGGLDGAIMAALLRPAGEA